VGEIIEMREKAVGYLNYADFKESMDTVVKKVEEGFVQIGYCLKVARDTDILKESGYSSVEEFAKAEYGLDKSRVSRFMEINDRFSEDGYSPYLQPQYQGYGWGKLAVMIMLPDGINKELTQEYSKADITAIKDEIKEEQKISDLEILMEEKDQIQERMENNLQRSIHQLGYTLPLLYRKLWHAYRDTEKEEDCSKETMKAVAPSGEGMCSVRLQGVGRLMLSFKGTDKDIILVNTRTEGKERYSWEDMREALSLLMGHGTPEEGWQSLYGEPFPEKGEVAPVQQEKKQSKVIKAAPAKKNSRETEKKMEKAPAAAGVPEEISPERLPQGRGSGDGISWKEPEKKEFRPIELPPQDAEYNLPVGKTMLRDIKEGQRYLILKKHDPYRTGNILHLQEQMDGEETGNGMDLKITHMTDDHGGITEGYCVLQFDILPMAEKQLPGQLKIEDMEQEQQDREE